MNFFMDLFQPMERYFSAYDESFSAANSPITLDIKGSLNTPAKFGYIKCPSKNAKILVEISTDGTNYGSQFVVDKYETFPLFGLKVCKVRITHSGTDSAYRVWAR